MTRGGVSERPVPIYFCNQAQKESETGVYRGGTRGAARRQRGYIGTGEMYDGRRDMYPVAGGGSGSMDSISSGGYSEAFNS